MAQDMFKCLHVGQEGWGRDRQSLTEIAMTGDRGSELMTRNSCEMISFCLSILEEEKIRSRKGKVPGTMARF